MAIQSQTATFTGVEAYIDITWVDTYANFRLFCGVSTTDSSVVSVALVNPSNPAIAPTAASVRVVPTALFSGTVDVVNLEVI